MKNSKSFSKSRVFHLHHAFVFSIMIAFGALAMNILSGCSAGPDDGKTNPGMVTTTIYGRIVDEAGKAMQGVAVTAGTQPATTDMNGFFILKDATVPEGRAVVIAKKAGYFNAARAEAPGSLGVTRMQLSMMSNIAATNVSGTNGGTVNIPGGASIKFGAGSFTDASGKAYTGTVSVAARFLDPSKSSFYNFFSGDEEAQRTDGTTTNLVSCGVIRVELRGSGGETLNLDPAMPATLTCPKPADPKAPSTIQLWSFDETLGKWKEEGTATLQGNNYVGTVTHFTDYNFDYCGVDNGTLEFRIVCNTAPIEGVTAQVLGRKVISGPDGIIHIRRVAADGRPVDVSVLSADNGGLYYLSAPVSVTVVKDQMNNAGDITLSSPCPAELSGTLMCGDLNVEGLVTVSDGTNINYVYTRSGNWAIQAPADKLLTVDATNSNGDLATTVNVPALTSGEQRNIGTIGLCSTGPATYTDIVLGSNQGNEVISFSPDGSRLAALAYQGTSKVTVYETKTGNILSVFTPSDYYSSMEFSSDNTKLLLASTYNTTSLYDVSMANASLITSISNVIDAKLYDDGTKIIASTGSGINIYSAVNGAVITSLTPSNVNGKSIFAFIRDENAIAYRNGTDLHIWDVMTNAEIRSFPMAGSTVNILYSEEGHTVSANTTINDYSFYDTKSGQKIGTATVSTTRDSINFGGSTMLLTQHYLYDGSSVNGGSAIRITKIADGTSIVKLFLGGTNVTSVAASRNEQYVAAAANGTIRIWKLQ